MPDEKSLCDITLGMTNLAIERKAFLMKFHFLHISKAIFQGLSVSTYMYSTQLCNIIDLRRASRKSNNNPIKYERHF